MAGMLDGVPDLTESDKLLVQAKMVELDQQQSIQMYQTITRLAFNQALEKSESSCIENITNKFMAHFNRVNQRFSEEFGARNQAAAAAAQQQQQQQ